MIATLIARWSLSRNARKHRVAECYVCHKVGPYCCLPFLGARKFCASCARRILYWHAHAEHRCVDHETKPESEHVATRNDRT